MKTLFGHFVFLALFCSGVFAADPYVIILGTAQDAGAPQMGCMSQFCQKAFADRKKRVMVSSIGLIDPDTGKRWIFDATPDLPAQFQLLKKATGDDTNRLDGIFLTHAHIGHYTGLMYLGRESMSSKETPIFAMPRMKTMLKTNAPWSQLVSLKNILLKEISNNREITLTDRLTVTPFVVPHRDEFSETVGYRIKSENKSLIFLPDIDKWSKWKTLLQEVVRANDYLLLDGTFYADGEIPRPMSEVPHPFVSETIELLGALPREQRSKVHFIHFNHSNPLLQGNKSKRRALKKRGFGYTKTGQKFVL